MTQPNIVTCPECGADQARGQPFCENCGFRLGRAETAEEGHAAVQRLAVKEDTSATVREHPAVAPPAIRGHAAVTEPEGRPAVTPEDIAASGLQADSDAIPEIPIGTRQLGDEPTNRPTEHLPVWVPPSEASGLIAVTNADPESRGVRYAVLIGLWLASLGATAMLVAHYSAKPEDEALELGTGAVTKSRVEIPAGSFERGLNEQIRAFILLTCLRRAEDDSQCDEAELLAGEFPEERVELEAFSIESTEITNGDWDRCSAAGKCPSIDYRSCKVYTHQGLQTALRVPKSMKVPSMPVTCVTKPQAQAYCEWAGGHLPSGDQWEKAARGPDGRMYPWGANWISDAANWAEADVTNMPVVGRIDGHEWAAEPGQYAKGKSPYGVWDAAGNVAEWVTHGDDAKAHARGGSWASTPFDLRTTGRLELDPDTRRADVGFRCAYDD